VHEYSLVEELLARVEQIAREKGATSVRSVQIRLGELSGVEPTLLRTAYETFRERTLCANAELTLDLAPAVWACPRCERRFAPGEILRCCEVPARLSSGDELMLQRVELDVP